MEVSLSESEISTIENALMIASERFRQDIRDINDSNLNPLAKGRLIAQFNGQVAANASLLQKLTVG